jgi:hypothetical protein
MPRAAFEKPVDDTVPKINDEIAVGEDLEFQRRWWVFERVCWIFIGVLIVLDLAGVFGRGPAANATLINPEMHVDYERIERSSTPSLLRIRFGSGAIVDGKIHLYVSESIVKELGNTRIIPQPETSAVGQGGITYTFAATTPPAAVTFALEPTHPSVTQFTVRVTGTPESSPPLSAKIVVLP